MPTWALLLLIFAASRVASSTVLIVTHAISVHAGRGFAGFDQAPDLADYLQAWDGLWYRQIAIDGYPGALPLDASGNIGKNPWAFLPLFPLLARVLMEVSGLPFWLAGSIVSTIFGAAAAVVLYRMLAERIGNRQASWSAALFCLGPLSFLLQLPYAESTFLFLMFQALHSMISRRYVPMTLCGVLASFAHPGALAIPAALGLVFVVRSVRSEPFPIRDRLAVLAAGVLLALSGLAWPIVAGMVTGDATAYFDTEMAWWRDYLGPVGFVPFTPWFLLARQLVGPAGVVIVVGVLVAAGWALARPSLRRLGPELLYYCIAYSAYLVAVFLPQQSLIRMLLPLAPLLGGESFVGSRTRRVTLLGASIALQPVGVLLFWVIWPP